MKILGHPIKEFCRPVDLATAAVGFALIFGAGPMFVTLGDVILADLGAILLKTITGVSP